jgi:glycosyltransferase involved in cell wall biosynthesis
MSRSPSLSILQVSLAAAGGGAEAVARTLHEGYRAQGHEATLAVGRRAHGDGVVQLRNADASRVPGAAWFWKRHDELMDQDRWRVALLARAPVAPRALWNHWRGREDFRFPSTRRLLASSPSTPDIVQLHNLHGDYFDLRRLPELSAASRVILTPHDAWLTTGHCAHSLDNDRWQVGCGECPYLDIYPAIRRDGTRENFRAKQAIFARSRVRVVTPSRWLLTRLELSMLNPAIDEARVIPYGIHLGRFHPGERRAARARLGLSPEGRIVVVAAKSIKTNPWKDFGTLRRALDDVTTPMRVLALGDAGPSETHGQAELRFVPDVPNTEVAEYLRAADVFVHPALADTFPLTVLEALACGVPVIATAVGGIPEQVAHGRTGLLVPLKDPRQLGQAIDRVLSDEGLRDRLGAAAALDALARFDVRDQIAAHLDWYEEIVANDERLAQTT